MMTGYSRKSSRLPAFHRRLNDVRFHYAANDCTRGVLRGAITTSTLHI